jgi:cobalt-zinc-cadmium efflux system membrane fusion protein
MSASRTPIFAHSTRKTATMPAARLAVVVAVMVAVVVTRAVFPTGAMATDASASEALAAHAHAGEAHAFHGSGESKEGRVRLSDAELAEFGVTLSVAGPGPLERSVELPGVVRPNEDRVAHIVPRFPGIVLDVRANIGESVSAGQVLAVVESSESLTAYDLTTLIDGTIIAKHITRGESVTRETQTFVVTDLSSVWIEIDVYQRDLDKVRAGQPVLVSRGHQAAEQAGRIGYVSPVLDEDTRTAHARVVLSNLEGQWRPGMFVVARVIVAVDSVDVRVPTSAVQRVDGIDTVFVQTPEGFEPRPVGIGRRNGRHVEIESGLTAGEHYASDGAYILKAERERDELDSGHHH